MERTSYISMRWWLLLYHGENKLYFNEMMTAAISWREQVIFQWDDDRCYIMERTSYISMRWWLLLYHGENKLYFNKMMTAAISWREQVIFQWDDDRCYIMERTSYSSMRWGASSHWNITCSLHDIAAVIISLKYNLFSPWYSSGHHLIEI
jgi:glutamine cyclotransferase